MNEVVTAWKEAPLLHYRVTHFYFTSAGAYCCCVCFTHINSLHPHYSPVSPALLLPHFTGEEPEAQK